MGKFERSNQSCISGTPRNTDNLMKPILSITLSLLMLSWLFPRFQSIPGYDYGGFHFLFSSIMANRSIDFPRIFLIDLSILAAGGAALALWRKS